MKKRLIMPIETVARELDARLYLSLKLLNSKPGEWEIVFGHHKKCGKYMKSDRNTHLGFIYLSSGLMKNSAHFKNIVKDSGKYCLMDEEGGVFGAYETKGFPRGGYNHKGLQYIDRIFFWGEEERGHWFRRHKLLKQKQAVLSGNPRFDISKKDFNMYFEKTSQIDKYRKNYILVIFAFGTVNPIIPMELEARYWASISEGSKLEAWNIERKFQEKSFPLYLEGIKKLIERNSDQQFVIRPHPVENIETYQYEFSKFQNVEINNSGPVQEWLPKAKLFIHNGCTTAIEAAINGLTPICFAPFVDKESIQVLTYEVSHVIENSADLSELVHRSLNTEVQLEDQKGDLSFLKKHIYNVDLDATNIIVEHLNELEFDQPMDFSIKLYSFIQQLRNFVPSGLRTKMYQCLGRKGVQKEVLSGEELKQVRRLLLERQLKKCPGIELETLELKQNVMHQLRIIEKSVNIKKLEDDLFLLD
jgi:surface carbohydrate biosynthesis protein